jgi:hypothetical protein
MVPQQHVIPILENGETKVSVNQQDNFCEPTVHSEFFLFFYDHRLCFKVPQSIEHLELVTFNITVTMIRIETFYFNRHYQSLTQG